MYVFCGVFYYFDGRDLFWFRIGRMWMSVIVVLWKMLCTDDEARVLLAPFSSGRGTRSHKWGMRSSEELIENWMLDKTLNTQRAHLG